MKYVSLFSGIEAATAAWEPLGWEPVCFAEFDEFAQWAEYTAWLHAEYDDGTIRWEEDA